MENFDGKFKLSTSGCKTAVIVIVVLAITSILSSISIFIGLTQENVFLFVLGIIGIQVVNTFWYQWQKE